MTVMMIEHDMGVVMDISHRVMVLDFGRKIAEGDPAAVLADPHVRRAYLGEEDEVLVDPEETPLPSTADLKSLHHERHVLSGTSDR
jgi:branched-chain amino acid transport system ATP-binding protein